MAPSHAISWPLGGRLLAHIQFPEILMRGSVVGIAVGKARVRELQWRTAAVLLTPLLTSVKTVLLTPLLRVNFC